MRAHVFEAEQRIPRPLPEVFEFFSRPQNLERITPPWLSFTLTSGQPESMAVGTLLAYRLRIHGVPVTWITRIDALQPEQRFVDRQLTGPYKLWVHRHEFQADGDETIVRDRVHYALPFGLLGAVAHLGFVRRDIERIFAYRHEAIERLLGRTSAMSVDSRI